MLRLLHLLVFLVAGCLVGMQGTQDRAPTHAPLPGPVNKTYALDGSNRLDFTIRLVDTGTEAALPFDGFECANNCRGRVHYLHSTCDTSCDAACLRLHQGAVDPEVPARGVPYNSMSALAAAAQ